MVRSGVARAHRIFRSNFFLSHAMLWITDSHSACPRKTREGGCASAKGVQYRYVLLLQGTLHCSARVGFGLTTPRFQSKGGRRLADRSLNLGPPTWVAHESLAPWGFATSSI